MSKKTWLREFYPTPADRFSPDNDLPHTALETVRHSLRKWEGLTKENLDKHGLFRSPFGSDTLLWRRDDTELGAYDEKVITVNSTSCSLCMKYYNIALYDACELCPLAKSLGRSCARQKVSGILSTYGQFTINENPLPMIEALKETERKLIEGEIE